MGYADNSGVIIYWNPNEPFVIHISHNVWFDEYNSRLSIEDNQNPVYLLLQKYPESIIHNSDLPNLILCELDLA